MLVSLYSNGFEDRVVVFGDGSAITLSTGYGNPGQRRRRISFGDSLPQVAQCFIDGEIMAAPGKCILVTGPPGVGKTTLIRRVFESLKTSDTSLKIQGFCTSEIREGNERVGFEVVTLDGRRAPLASTTISTPESVRWPAVGKYKVDIASFESLALPELKVKEDTDLFIIDEIGKMELYSSTFFPAVLNVLESNIPILASIPVPKFGRDIPAVARLRDLPRATVFTLSKMNRDAMKEQIYTQLVDSIRKC